MFRGIIICVFGLIAAGSTALADAQKSRTERWCIMQGENYDCYKTGSKNKIEKAVKTNPAKKDVIKKTLDQSSESFKASQPLGK